MAGQVVHDHDVARSQFRGEHLGHVGLESVPVDRPVEHKGSHDPVAAQARHKGSGFPMPVRHAHPQALPLRGSTPQPSHVGCGPCLVNEDQPIRVEVELLLKPSLALP